MLFAPVVSGEKERTMELTQLSSEKAHCLNYLVVLDKVEELDRSKGTLNEWTHQFWELLMQKLICFFKLTILNEFSYP